MQPPESDLSVPLVTARERACAWLVALALLPLAAYLIAGAYYFDRPFWSDEVLSWLIASDASFDHGAAALAGGVDTNAPLLHLLFRAVGGVFGPTPIVYRLTCAAAMSAAEVALYLVLRRAVRPMAASVGVLAFAALPIVIAHTTEARFYSIELAGLLWSIFWLMRRREERTPRSAAGLALATIVLCGVHYFGVVALGCLLAAELIASPAGPSRFRTWLSNVYPATAGVAMTACLLPLLVAQRAAMRDAGGTWVPDELAMNLRTTLVSLLPAPAIVALLTVAIIAARSVGVARLRQSLRSQHVLLVAAAGYVGVMLAFDRIVQPVLVPRYFIVVVPALAAVVAAIASQASVRAVRIMAVVLVVALFGQWWQIRVRALAPSGRSAAGLIASVSTIDGDEPIVSDWLGHALPIWTSRPALRDRVFYLPDARLHEAGFDQAIRYERQMASCVQRFYGMPGATDLKTVGRQERFILLSEFPETVAERFRGWTVTPLGDVTLQLTRPNRRDASAVADGD